MTRRLALSVALAATALLLATATAGAGGVTAHTARSCSVPDYPGSGYFTSLTVKGDELRDRSQARPRVLPLPHPLGAQGPMPQARAPLLLP